MSEMNRDWLFFLFLLLPAYILCRKRFSTLLSQCDEYLADPDEAHTRRRRQQKRDDSRSAKYAMKDFEREKTLFDPANVQRPEQIDPETGEKMAAISRPSD